MQHRRFQLIRLSILARSHLCSVDSKVLVERWLLLAPFPESTTPLTPPRGGGGLGGSPRDGLASVDAEWELVTDRS